jgi:hypothetical protein
MALLDFLRRRRPEDDFAERVIRRLRDLGWPHEVRYVPGKFAIETDDKGGVLNLRNLFNDWRTYPRHERAAQIDRAIAPVFESGLYETYEDAAPKLIPLVRSLTDLQGIALESDPPSLELWQPVRPIAGPLAALVAIDLPNSVSFLPHDKLEEWGKSFDEVFERSMENLVAESPVRFERMPEGFYLSDYRDTFDSSRLLMPELFVALQLPGDPVAVAIARDKLVVAGSQDISALNAMAAFVVEAFNQASRPMSWLPLILRDRAWEPFEPEPTSELGALRDLAVRQRVWDYGLQAPRLESYLHAEEQDVFVAPQELGYVKGDATVWTTWTQDVAALLPRAHLVGLTDRDGRTLMRSWQDVEAVCGVFSEDTRFHPPRFVPPVWPSAEGWRRLSEEFRAPEWWGED